MGWRFRWRQTDTGNPFLQGYIEVMTLIRSYRPSRPSPTKGEGVLGRERYRSPTACLLRSRGTTDASNACNASMSAGLVR